MQEKVNRPQGTPKVRVSPRTSHELLSAIVRCVSSYELFQQDKRVVVAVSGGKDSCSLLTALSLLGYEVVPAIVDMGYEIGWSTRVALAVFRLGFKPHILSADAFVAAHGSEVIPTLDVQRLDLLRSFDFKTSSFGTPCTLCYNSKLSLLTRFAVAQGIRSIAFGHHLTDAAASLLKSSLMYIDRWADNNETFSRKRFLSLVDSYADDLATASAPERSKAYTVTAQLIAQGVAGTDEPPLEVIESLGAIRIVRPMFQAPEDVIIEYAHKLGVRFEDSGCGHGATRESETPREAIHRRILRQAPSALQRNNTVAVFRNLIERTLTLSGESKVRVRAERGLLLGEQYKPAIGNDEKL